MKLAPIHRGQAETEVREQATPDREVAGPTHRELRLLLANNKWVALHRCPPAS